MKSSELAEHVLAIVTKAQSRVMVEGRGQYESIDVSGRHRQQFESLPIDDLAELMEEELLDQINYAVMMILRLREYREELRRHEQS